MSIGSIMRRSAGVFVVSILSLVAACGDDGPQPPLAEAAAYEVLSIEDISSGTRIRLRAYILAPSAHDIDQRAQTAMQAAVDLYQNKLPQLATVTLLDAPDGTAVAIADYAPDHGGIDGKTPLAYGAWEISATDPPRSVAFEPYPPQ